MIHHPIINIQDLIVAPIYLSLLTILALMLRNKATKGKPSIKKYYMPALYMRYLGCFLSALMYQYYYRGGDTVIYYGGALAVWNAFWDNPMLAYDFMLSSPNNYPEEIFKYFIETKSTPHLLNHSTLIIQKVGGFLSLVTFKSYLSIGFILSFFSFLGCWKLFEVFHDQYPHLKKQLAIATLFIPSVFFWGAAGLMKDTIIIAALGFTTWGGYYLFIKRKKQLISILYIVIGIYFILVIKAYIAYALFPALTVWLFLKMNANIKNKLLKKLAFPLIVIVGFFAAVVLFQVMIQYGENKYSPKNVIQHASNVQQYHKYLSEREGSLGYTLSEYEPTLEGVLALVPQAINVALFRPYPWEVRKAILVPSALESIITLLLTIFVFLKVGFLKSLRIIVSDSNILFCLMFALVFSFAMGFSSYNFGALARYKIPALPFYFIALSLIYDARKKRRRKHPPNIPFKD